MHERAIRARVVRDYQIQYSKPLDVAAGAKVIAGSEDDEFPGWRWCKSSDGHEGWVPMELLRAEGEETTMVQDYSSRELGVTVGEEVAIEDERHAWLLVRNVRGERGWIPETRVVRG